MSNDLFHGWKWLGVCWLLQGGGAGLLQQQVDERGRRDLFQLGLVVEDEAVVEDGQGDGFDIVETDGGAAVQQGGRAGEICFW